MASAFLLLAVDNFGEDYYIQTKTMIKYNRYLNNEDHVWYDSSNVVYSKCYDSHSSTNNLKVVYKGGRTYLFKDVAVDDYIQFKLAESNGGSSSTFLSKKYKGLKLTDTDLVKLNEQMERFIAEEKETDETPLSNLLYHIDYVNNTGEFNLSINGKVIYNGLEGQVSILTLFRSMGIKFSMSDVEEIINNSDEKLDCIEVGKKENSD